MGNALFNIGMDSNRSQFMVRQRIESLINLPRLFATIDAEGEDQADQGTTVYQ